MSRTCSSKIPRVFGFVSMRASVFGPAAASRALRSTRPSFDGISIKSNPSIPAEAGFVPCAVSGMMTSCRSSPRVVRLRQEKASVLSLSPGRGLQCDRVHPRDLREKTLQLVQEPERPLHGRLVLVWMDPGDRRKGRELLREFRVEFHCARSERVEPRVDSEVHLRKAREVPDDIMLREIRDREVLAPNLRGDEVREVDVRVGGGSLLHEERLVPRGLAASHRSASRAPSRRPIASGVWRPVVANTAASLSSGSC